MKTYPHNPFDPVAEAKATAALAAGSK